MRKNTRDEFSIKTGGYTRSEIEAMRRQPFEFAQAICRKMADTMDKYSHHIGDFDFSDTDPHGMDGEDAAFREAHDSHEARRALWIEQTFADPHEQAVILAGRRQILAVRNMPKRNNGMDKQDYYATNRPVWLKYTLRNAPDSFVERISSMVGLHPPDVRDRVELQIGYIQQTCVLHSTNMLYAASPFPAYSSPDNLESHVNASYKFGYSRELMPTSTDYGFFLSMLNRINREREVTSLRRFLSMLCSEPAIDTARALVRMLPSLRETALHFGMKEYTLNEVLAPLRGTGAVSMLSSDRDTYMSRWDRFHHGTMVKLMALRNSKSEEPNTVFYPRFVFRGFEHYKDIHPKMTSLGILPYS